MITSIVENYQKSNKLPIKNMFFGKKKEIKNESEDTSSKDLAIVTQMNQEFAKSLDLKETLQNSLEVIIKRINAQAAACAFILLMITSKEFCRVSFKSRDFANSWFI